MLGLNLKRVVNPQLIPMGLGVFGATFLATMLGDLFEKQTNPFVVEYRRELVGAILTVGGTVMMQGSREMRTVGMAIGSTGVAAVASGLVRRVTGGSPSAVNTGNGSRTGGPVSGGGGGGGLGGSVVNPPPGHYNIV